VPLRGRGAPGHRSDYQVLSFAWPTDHTHPIARGSAAVIDAML